eukprot:m.61258 g.61258  ORF g.61258 m.61258 type:complete len:454 (+) comp15755_c0_seq5:979-2340(+)
MYPAWHRAVTLGSGIGVNVCVFCMQCTTSVLYGLHWCCAALGTLHAPLIIACHTDGGCNALALADNPIAVVARLRHADGDTNTAHAPLPEEPQAGFDESNAGEHTSGGVSPPESSGRTAGAHPATPVTTTQAPGPKPATVSQVPGIIEGHGAADGAGPAARRMPRGTSTAVSTPGRPADAETPEAVPEAGSGGGTVAPPRGKESAEVHLDASADPPAGTSTGIHADSIKTQPPTTVVDGSRDEDRHSANGAKPSMGATDSDTDVSDVSSVHTSDLSSVEVSSDDGVVVDDTLRVRVRVKRASGTVPTTPEAPRSLSAPGSTATETKRPQRRKKGPRTQKRTRGGKRAAPQSPDDAAVSGTIAASHVAKRQRHEPVVAVGAEVTVDGTEDWVSHVKKGALIQAVDCGAWYDAKIVKVLAAKQSVEVKYIGWGDRYNKIFPYGSTQVRLRSQAFD